MKSVQKYGGEYLRDMEALEGIATYIARHYRLGDKLVLVVAALQEIAQAMMERLHVLKTDVDDETLDLLFSAAEQQTAALMAAALEKEGLRTEVIPDIKGDSLNLADLEDRKHDFRIDQIEAALRREKIAIVPGYQGIGRYQAEDVKGRYGAAATAVVIAAGLGCNCSLFGNTRGLYSRGTEETGRAIPQVTYEEAMELTLLGNNDLESLAIEQAKNFGVRLYVGPAMEEEERKGTYIMDKNLIVQESAVAGIAVSDEIVVYTLKGIPAEGDCVAELFALLEDLNVNIDMISQQSCGEEFSSISFSCDQEKIEEIDQAFAGNGRMRELKISKREGLSLISVVGAGMANHAGVAGKVFSVLAQEGIWHYNITTSEISISAAIDSENKSQAVVALSEAFRL